MSDSSRLATPKMGAPSHQWKEGAKLWRCELCGAAAGTKRGDAHCTSVPGALMSEPTNTCVVCEAEFTAENPCCCDDALHTETDLCNPPHAEGETLHENGTCVKCCAPNHTGFRPVDGVAGYERGE